MSTRMKDKIAEASKLLQQLQAGELTYGEMARRSAEIFEVDTQPGLFEVEQLGRNGGASRPLGHPIKKV